MSAPNHIVDALECVVSLFFSSVRHQYRAAFIMCDELVEITCYTKIKHEDHTYNGQSFHAQVTHQHVNLPTGAGTLGRAVKDCRETRNNMQHASGAATVDEYHCADAILDAVRVIDHCFPGTSTALPDRLKVALRVVGLYGQNADAGVRNRFADAMRQETWRPNKKSLRVSETAITPGDRQYWHLVILSEFQQIEQILNRVCPP